MDFSARLAGLKILARFENTGLGLSARGAIQPIMFVNYNVFKTFPRKLSATMDNRKTYPCCNVKKFHHISPVLRNVCWLPVKTQLYCRDAILTLKCMTTGQAPEYLISMFITRGSTSGRITRNFSTAKLPPF